MSQSLGSIHVELTANTAQFVEGMSRAAATARKNAVEISDGFSRLQTVANRVAGGLSSINPALGGLASSIANAARAASDASKNMASMGSAVSTLGTIAAGAGAAMATLGVGTAALVVHTAESAAKMYEQSQMAGVSTEALSRLSFAAERVGVSQESVVTALERMSRAAVASLTATRGAANPFRDLGISVKDAAGQMKPADELFSQVAGRLGAMTDTTRRTALEMQLFGRSGADLGPLLQLGSDGIEKLRTESDRLNLTISTQTGKAAEEFETNLKHLQEVSEGFANSLTSHLLPKLNDVIANLSSMKGSDLASAYETLLFGPFVNPLGVSPLRQALSTAPALRPPAAPHLNPFVPPDPAKALAAEEAQRKLQAAIQQATSKYQEQIATVGKLSGAAEDWKLHALGAISAQIAPIDALRARAELLTAVFAKYDWKPSSGSVAAIETLKDKYAGLSAAGATWVANLEHQANAISALASAASSLPSEPLFQGVGPTLQQSTSDNAAATIKSLQEQIANFGQRDPTAGLGFAALPEQIAQVQKLSQELEILQAGGTLQWVAQLNSKNLEQVQAWDKAALASTNFGDRSRAMLNELIIQTESLGEKISKTFSGALNDATGELAKMVVTGKHEFTKLAESMSESLLKASFQSSISQFMTLIVGKPKVPGQGADASGVAAAAATQHSALSSIAAGIGKAFGVKSPGAAGHGPLGTVGDPLYVAFSNVTSGAVDPLGIGKLPLSKSAGLSGAIGGSLNGMAAFSNILANLPKSSASQTPFGDFGGSLQQAPAAPGGAASTSSTGARTLGTLSSVSSLAHSGVELGQDMAKLWPKIASIFGGFLANGGDVTPGHAYIVGENHPEFFVPKQAGTVSPSLKMGSGGGVTNNFHMHIHGVHDADSFRRSQSQIYAGMHAQLAHANSRNG